MSNGHSEEGIAATAGPDYNDGHDSHAQEILEREQHEQQTADMKGIDAQQMRELRMQVLNLKDDTHKMSIALKRPFDPKDVKDRPGPGGRKLYHIDARHVMKRLDEVFGIANWQTKYHETPSGRVMCELSVRINSEWITKSDGAGDTGVEKEKGAISDALKRSAVLLGIGAYLYNDAAIKNGVFAPWATPEGYDKIIAKHYS